VVTTIVSVASGRPYQVVHNGMVSGAKVYIDRPEFIVTGVFGPETGFELIRTSFADGTATEDRFLVLHVNRRVGVIVMMPGRDPLPSWFNSCPSGSPPIGCWEHTGRGFELENSNDPDFFDVPTHRVQVFEPGTITLGPRRATTTSVPQMYWVAVYPCEADFSDCPPPIESPAMTRFARPDDTR